MVNELCKSLETKGLIEDIHSGTITHRYFYKPQDKVNDIADQLIKSLYSMTKADEQTKMRFEVQAKNRLADRNLKRQRSGLAPITVDQMKNPGSSTPPPPLPKASPTPKGAATLPGVPNTLVGEIGSNYSSQALNYGSKVKKDEDEVEKSGYGPKIFGAYNAPDNAKRKANNTSDQLTNIGPNRNVKAYSTKPGQLSGSQSADIIARAQAKANKKQPVKTFSPEEKTALAEQMKLKKSWGQHLPFPSAEEEILNYASQANAQRGEDVMANQLANLMNNRAMLGQPPPSQPTDEEMFGGGVVTEEMAKAAEHKWGNTFNNWMAEATKPISQRFAYEAEEIAYWNKIKISDNDDGQSGY